MGSANLCICKHSISDHGMLNICVLSDCDCEGFTQWKPDFHCGKCGREADTAPDPPARAVCEDCCEDHDYRHVAGERTWRCLNCNREPDPDWYNEEDAF